ncbi:sodium:proton antiporter [Pseudactinotalea sp. Z1739]|uniref:sodium:proton antiporter n=1 Tax=Pseudactinotalea sp. Z1739 TaxID=3413028 RepID=UPI003C7C80D6
MTLALTAGLLIAGAVYLILQREMFRVILGFILFSHGANLILFAAGGTSQRAEPIGGDLDPATVADPLPQAFVLTAIVIAFSITIVMLMLAVAGRRADDTHDSIPDDADDDGSAEHDGDAGSAEDDGDAGRAGATAGADPGGAPARGVQPR